MDNYEQFDDRDFKVEHNGFPHGVFLIKILTILLLEE